jgi:uncharacterized membrane protein required for colicin V production
MIFGIVLLLLVLLVAFIHFVQGFFSSVISLILTIIAAAISLGFHDRVVNALKGKFGDSLTALVLCSLFAVTYVILRMIFDRAVPGNVRLQSTIDKIGAAIMGFFAGMIAAGILAIAVQTMPFNASIFGYSRYTLGPVRKDVTFQPNPTDRAIGRDVVDEMKNPTFKDEDVSKLLLPADDMVLNLFNTLSNGPLSGSQRFNAIHANYLQEAFGTRVGIEIGAKHTAVNIEGGDQQISVDKIGVRDRVKAVEDSELPEIRDKKGVKKDNSNLGKDEAKLAKEDLRATGNQKILIIRTLFSKGTGEEKDSIARFTPAAVRLVTHDSNGAAKNYYPLGTMDAWSGGTFWPNRIDDPMFIKAEDDAADFVFMIDDLNEALEGAVVEPKKGKPEATKAPAAIVMKEGVFLEVKHLARVDLGGKSVENAPWTADPAKPGVMRKVRMKVPPAPPA